MSHYMRADAEFVIAIGRILSHLNEFEEMLKGELHDEMAFSIVAEILRGEWNDGPRFGRIARDLIEKVNRTKFEFDGRMFRHAIPPDWPFFIRRRERRWELMIGFVPGEEIAGYALSYWETALGEAIDDRLERRLRHQCHVIGAPELRDALNITLSRDIEGSKIAYLFGVCKGKAEQKSSQYLNSTGF